MRLVKVYPIQTKLIPAPFVTLARWNRTRQQPSPRCRRRRQENAMHFSWTQSVQPVRHGEIATGAHAAPPLDSCRSSGSTPFIRRNESNRPSGWVGRCHQLPDRFEDLSKPPVRRGLKLFQPARELLVRRDQTPQAHERAHDFDVDVDRPRAFQDARQHGNALFGKRERRG